LRNVQLGARPLTRRMESGLPRPLARRTESSLPRLLARRVESRSPGKGLPELMAGVERPRDV
jgi:hypothetical protein